MSAGSPMNQKSQQTGLSLKTFLVGTFGIVLACSMSVHYAHLVQPGDMSSDWFPYGAAIAFLVILFGLNPLLRLISPRLELSRVELLLVFAMVFIATPLATKGFASAFLTNILAPLFFSNQSNRYWERLGQYLPVWLYPCDKNAVVWFWEGTPAGQSIPWAAWVSPFLHWGVIFGAIYGLISSMVVIMRKQWVENERLIFPMMEAPLSLLEDYEKGRRIPPIMRTPLFWVGVGLTAVVYGSHILNHINPSFPALRLFGTGVIVLQFSENWLELRLHLFPMVLAFAFLAKRDILLSVWVFGLLVYFEFNILKMVGYSAGAAIRYEERWNPAIAWQCLGGLVVFVLVGLYMARRHLREVVRKVIFNDPTVDDSREIIGYRPAGILFLASFLTLEVLMIKMGMTPSVATTMIVTLIIFHLAVTRFVMEGGLVLFRPSAPAIAVVIGLFGSKGMSLASLGAVAACAPINSDYKTGVMPALANSAKLVEGERLRRGTLLKVGLYAIALGSIVSVLVTMLILYNIGAINTQSFQTKFHAQRYFSSIIGTLDNIAQPDRARLAWGGVGAVIMCILTLGRYNFAWWPLHPIGLPVAMPTVVWGFQPSLFSVFVAWLAKSIILRVGGTPLYTKAKPFFIGLLIGHVLMVAVGYICDIIHGPPGAVLIAG